MVRTLLLAAPLVSSTLKRGGMRAFKGETFSVVLGRFSWGASLLETLLAPLERGHFLFKAPTTVSSISWAPETRC